MLSIFKKKSTKELIYSNEFEKLQKRINSSNVNLIDEDGRTALYYAIQANNTQAASFLLNKNADAHLASSSKENPVIHDVITRKTCPTFASGSRLSF